MNFKRNYFKYFSFLIVTLTMLFLFGGRTANAETTKTVDTITKLEIKNDKGGAIDGKIGKWDKFRVAGEFALEGKGVTAGDTTVIKLADPIIISSTDFDLNDEASGQTVAKAHVDKETGTITLTYTSFVDTHSNVSGKFFFYAAVDSAKQKNSGDVPVKVNVDGKPKFSGKVSYDGVGDTNNYVVKKSSWVSPDSKTIHYIVPINRTSEALNNVKILDELKYKAAKYVNGSFEIWKGDWKYTNGSWKLENKKNVTDKYTKNIKDGSFEITLGNLAADDHFEIRYDVQLDYEPADGELLVNTVSLQSNDKVIKEVAAEHQQAEFYYLKPETYYLRLFVDSNHNGIWDTGDYAKDRQPEAVYYYPGKIECKAKWDLTESWNPTSTPLYQQKPGAITKQKADKQKTIRRRNAERAKQMGLPYTPETNPR